MRITYISSSIVPSRRANSIQVMKMCQAFAQSGHSPTLVAYPGMGPEAGTGQELWRHYGIRHPFPIRLMSASRYLNRYDYVIRAVFWAKTSGSDLVYARNLAAAALAAWAGLPTIFEAHQLIQGRLDSLYYRVLLGGRGFLRLVVISHALRSMLLRRHEGRLSVNQTLVAHDGVDLDAYQGLPAPDEARRQLGIPPDRFTAGYFGHLYAGRGVELILKVAPRCPDVHFRIAGGNPEAVEEYRGRVCQSGVRNVELLGFLPSDQLPLRQASCDVLLMPYQHQVIASGGNDIAPFFSPLKMFEYMAAGRLIISSNLPVLGEVLNEGNAVLCSPEDVDAWQDALQLALRDQPLRDRLGEQARRDVVQYSWLRRAQLVLAGLPGLQG